MTTNYRDDEGIEHDLSADSVEALAQQLPEDYAGPRLTVRDETDSIRGWIGGQNDWAAQ